MVNFMLLTLYKTLDGDNVINKTLEEPTDFNINLKGEVDINNPDLLMVRLTGLDYNDYNYAYLPDFERYYFIRSCRLINASIYKLSLECDFIETYKADILSSNANFRKSISSGDYGEVFLDKTGKEIITDYASNEIIELERTFILSTLGGVS